MQPRANVILLLLTLCLCSAAQAVPYTGIVTVDSVEAQAGSSFSVAVRMNNNNVALAGLAIPLKYDNQFLTLDSVSFVGSMLPEDFTGSALIDPVKKSVEIFYIPPIFVDPIPTFNTASGIVARLHFKVSPAATPITIPLDSINYDSSFTWFDSADNELVTTHIWKKVYVNDNTGDSVTSIYFPGFVKGAVKVLVATGVEDEPEGLPTVFALEQNYPNPFNPVTVIEYSIPRASEVKLEVFNVLGQVVRTLVDRPMGAGRHTVEFSATSQPSGVYFYRLTHDYGSITRKMVVLK